MTKILFITEKSTAMKNLITALGGETGMFDGYEYAIATLAGHIMRRPKPMLAAYPQYMETVGKFNNVGSIPWSPEYFDWQKKEITPSSNGYNQRLFNTIKRYLDAGYEPCIATDIDESREGDALAWEVIKACNYKGRVWREHHTDESVDAFQESIRNKFQVFEDDSDLLMAEARSAMDFLTQQEVSLATVRVQDEGYDLGQGKTVPGGRLQSRVMKSTADQIKAYESFKPSSEWESRYRLDNLTLKGEGLPRYKSLSQWTGDNLPKEVRVKEVRQVPGYTIPPKPLTLTRLSQMLTRMGMNLKRALEIADVMYKDHIISYPRSEDSTIKPDQFKRLVEDLDGIVNLLNLPSAAFTHRTPRTSTHVHPRGSHGGLHPGRVLPSSLDDLDQTYGKGASVIYKLIANRSLMMFLENTEWVRHEYETIGTPQPFRGSIRIITKQGVVDPDEDMGDVEKSLPNLGHMAELFAFEEKARRPEKPTAEWLLGHLEKEGVGTEATRPQTVAEMIGLKDDKPLKSTKGLLSLTPLGKVGALFASVSLLGDLEGTLIVKRLMQEVRDGKITPEESLHRFTNEVIINDVKKIKELVLNLENSGIAQGRTYVDGEWNGKLVRFNSTFRGHTYTPDEQDLLLAGQKVTFQVAYENQQPHDVTVMLADLTFTNDKGERTDYVGSKVVAEEGYVYGVWNGRDVRYRSSSQGYTFTDAENEELQAGNKVQFTVQDRNGNPISAYGFLDNMVYQGNAYVGVRVVKMGYHHGVWKNTPVTYKASYRDYTFTDAENAALLAGQTIPITIKDVNGHKKDITGYLDVMSFTNDAGEEIKYVGFRAIYPVEEKEGYVVGEWRGETIRFKASYKNRPFTADENNRLLNDETITFLLRDAGGKDREIRGKLERQSFVSKDSKKTINFVGFKAEFEDRSDQYIMGTWGGREVKYRKMYMDHEFTDDENKRLQAGEQIIFTANTRQGTPTTVVGGLANLKTASGTDYVGFKSAVNDNINRPG